MSWSMIAPVRRRLNEAIAAGDEDQAEALHEGLVEREVRAWAPWTMVNTGGQRG